jgi:hypothetical protein
MACEALAQAERVVSDLRPYDRASLFSFDAELRRHVGFRDPAALESRVRRERIRTELKGLRPTWAGTNTDRALIAVADELNSLGDEDTGSGWRNRRIVLITDFQNGCRLDALQGYEWPPDVELAVRTVTGAGAANAGLHAALAPETEGENIRIRVTNDAASVHERFTIRWEEERNAEEGEPLEVYVPPGRSKAFRIPTRPRSPLRRKGRAKARASNTTARARRIRRSRLSRRLLRVRRGGDGVKNRSELKGRRPRGSRLIRWNMTGRAMVRSPAM